MKYLEIKKAKLTIVLKPGEKMKYKEIETMLLPFMVCEPTTVSPEIANYSSMILLISSGLFLFSNDILHKSWKYK